MLPPTSESDGLPAVRLLKSGFVYSAVVSAFVLGLYFLFLASVSADKVRPLAEEDLVRTATAKDDDKIAIALGALTESELAFVVIDDPLGPRDHELEQTVQQAAQWLTDSGLVVSVRYLHPIDLDYASVVEQNAISRFPAVLVVKKKGGVVLVTGDLSAKNLTHAYHAVWGKKADCGAAKNAVY